MKIEYILAILYLCICLCLSVKLKSHYDILKKLDELKYDERINKDSALNKQIMKNNTEIMTNANKTNEVIDILIKKCGNNLSKCYFNTVEDEELIERTNKELIQSVVSLQTQLDQLKNQVSNKN